MGAPGRQKGRMFVTRSARDLDWLAVLKRCVGMMALLVLATACTTRVVERPTVVQRPPTTVQAPRTPQSVAAMTDALGRPVNADTVRVALLVPLSGPGSDLGPALVNAAQMAVLDLGGPNFQLMPRDAGSTPESAGAAAQAALAEGAQLILGPLFSPTVGPVGRAAAARGVNVVAFSTDPSVAGGNVFLMGIMPADQVDRVVRYGVGHGRSRYAVLAPNTAYGQTIIAAMQTAAARHGARMTQAQTYDANGADYGEAVRTLSQSQGGFDALMLPDVGSRLRIVAPLVAHYGANSVQLLGTGQWDDGNVGAESALVGAWFAAPDPALRADFQRRYQSNFGQSPPRLATLAYDAVALAAVLARTPGVAPFDRSLLTDPSGFAGIDGIFRFGPTNIAERGLAVLEVTRDGSRMIDPGPSSFSTPGF